METLVQALRNLGPMRIAVMGIVMLGLIGFFIYLTTRLSSPQLALLYGDLETSDSGKIVQQLEAQKIPFELRNKGREIWVPGDQALKLRVVMADKGLPNGGSIGYELFDNAESLGTTNFQQNVNLVRALEGELSRTIRTIKGVKAARVHLVLPKRELFSREKQEPTASIAIRMSGGRLSAGQVKAIQHLVATSIPGLNPNRIAVVDDKGTLLAKGVEEEGSLGDLAQKTAERKRRFENRLGHTIEEIVEKVVGFGKVRAEVSAEMDFDRVQTTEEKYDPDGQVVRSTETSEETISQKESEATPVSVDTNLPDPAALEGNDSATSSANESRVEERVNFEISKKIVNHIREAGTVRRLSVAVLVDGVKVPVPDSDNDEVNYEPRSDKELELIANLVRSAIGYNADRGDVVEVVNMRFVDPEKIEEPPIELFFGLEKEDLLRMAEILVLSIVAILVILLVVRPLVTRAFEAIPAAAAAGAAEAKLLAEQAAAAGAPALAGPGGVPVPADARDDRDDDIDELIDIDRVEGRVKASSVKKVGEIVDKHPEEALSIIRAWMYQEG